MFNLDVEESVQAKGVCRLQSDLPLNLFILDLGGGLSDRNNKVITEEDIISPPFQAVLRGFRNPAVRWAGQVSVDFKGFMSVFANTLYDMNKSETGLGGKVLPSSAISILISIPAWVITSATWMPSSRTNEMTITSAFSLKGERPAWIAGKDGPSFWPGCWMIWVLKRRRSAIWFGVAW